MWFGINFYPLTFQLFECVHIYIFDFNGDRIKPFSEIVNGIEILYISTCEMMAKMCSRAIRIIFQNKGFNRIIGCCLQQHASQLAAAEDADFLHCAKIGVRWPLKG